MTADRITIRLEDYIIEALGAEAKRRHQTVASLARTFIRDGLASYDAMNETLLQTQERIEARLKILEASVGANLHVIIERQTLAHPQMPGESEAEYGARLQGMYAKAVKAAMTKGERISIAVRDGDWLA